MLEAISKDFSCWLEGAHLSRCVLGTKLLLRKDMVFMGLTFGSMTLLPARHQLRRGRDRNDLLGRVDVVPAMGWDKKGHNPLRRGCAL